MVVSRCDDSLHVEAHTTHGLSSDAAAVSMHDPES